MKQILGIIAVFRVDLYVFAVCLIATASYIDT